MYIINVIPLIKIPYPNTQILSYFCSEKIAVGGLVKISIRNKKLKAIVLEQKKLEEEKIFLKKVSSFTIKPIEKIISKEPVLTKNQLKLLLWIANYYFVPVGMVAKIFLAKKYQIQDTKYEIQNLILTPPTKSLIFAPFKNLRKIIIENEESPLYRSWGRKPYYNAKNIACQLAKIHKAKLILKSNLPSVETYYWATKKKYRLKIQNPKSKIQNSKLIDLREELRTGNYSMISRELHERLKTAKKSILYISRRGTSTCILCRDCGYVVKCFDCEVPMIYHEGLKLVCHHCGNKAEPPGLCPNCKGYRIKYFGAGSQKVESEVKKLFPASPAGGPKTKIFRLDSDTAKNPSEQQKIINQFNHAKSAILIGTQMLLEKNIKSADLIGVVSMETILNLPDYKSSERVFQILNQLKTLGKKEFLLQTYNPESFVLNAVLNNDWQKFYNEEIKALKTLNYPPFSQIIKLTFEHKDSQKAEQEAKILTEKLNQQINNLSKLQTTNYLPRRQAGKLQILGPVPAFIPKIKGQYRWQIIIKSKIQDLSTRNKILMIVPPNWNIEVDPENLL